MSEQTVYVLTKVRNNTSRPEGGSFLLCVDTDQERETYGKFVPPYSSFPDHISSIQAVGESILGIYDIEGDLEGNFAIGPESIYLFAIADSYRNDNLKPFTAEEILDFERNGIAQWLPDAMKKLAESMKE